MTTTTMTITYKYYKIDKYPELYLDWVNNFITVERFAEYYGMSVKQAEDIIKIGRASDNFTKCIDWNALIENNRGKLQ